MLSTQIQNMDIQDIKQRFGIIGNSPLINRAIDIARQVAPTDITVLITGESGSGKEVFSHIIHQISARKHGPFIAVNCGAIPEGTIDSELFGHEKGSFTGAHEARKGYFEVVNGGTIFLDEVGELPLGTQARLLRVLESGEYIRVGSSKVQKTDARVIAATNVDMFDAVKAGKFREDLYYRLNTVPLRIPPLRDRKEDIHLIFRKFVADFSAKYRSPNVTLDEQAVQVLINYAWPGNVRQLKNIAEQIAVLEKERNINGQTLASYIPNDGRSNLPMRMNQNGTKEDFSERDILYKVLFDMKKDMNELKKLVLEAFQSGGLTSNIMTKHQNLFDDLEPSSSFEEKKPATPSTNMPLVIDHQSQTEEVEGYDDDTIEDIVHEEDDNSLSLEKKEKEMILKALRKHNNKRKYAASDLGISERTLYRKIKQYDIE